MSPELLAALVGAVTGGIVALVSSIAQVVTLSWLRERGDIICYVAAWELSFQYRPLENLPPEEREDQYRSRGERIGPSWRSGDKIYSWEEARAFNAEPTSAEYKPISAKYKFAANFLSTIGKNTAVLEYSVELLKDKQKIMTLLPNASNPVAEVDFSPGQATLLPAEDITTLHMGGSLDSDTMKAALTEANRVEFTARLSTDKTIRLELSRLS